LHEFGHAYFCKRFGGEVHTMGIMLMIFTPVPYMDATSSWRFRSRWKRLLVGAAGMIVELFVAALATFAWVNTGAGTLHSLAYNMMFVASVSTILFNINPLMRFDGYYMLTDLLDLPNLHQHSLRHLRHLGERYLFGLKKSESPARTRREVIWLTVFGLMSGIYRLVVFGSILLFVADRLLLLGILMALICAVTWILVPLGRYVHYLVYSPVLERQRPRAIGVTLVGVLLLGVMLDGISFPTRFRAPGVLQAVERSVVINETPGYLEALLAPPGSTVQAGQELLRLRNDELALEVVAAEARLAEVEARLRQAMRTEPANVRPLEALRDSVAERLTKLRLDQKRLLVCAQNAGVWVAPQVRDYVGRWLARGADLGLVVNPTAFEFTATVRQDDVNNLFQARTPQAELRLRGQAATVLSVPHLRLVPASVWSLPSAALGWQGGGEMAVAPDDPQGRRAAEPFFEVRAQLPPRPGLVMMHGRSGKIRFEVDPRPLLQQWWRRFWQLLQRRYQL
jgi:putative peptide zinc metalloprotease protein